MSALPLADSTSATPAIPDNRRITEHDPRVVALKAKTVRKLQASVKRLIRDLRPGSELSVGEAQSQFIHRHVDILRAAYTEAHRMGQRQYFGAVSREPQRWARQVPDAETMARRMAFYAPSVAKMAREAAVFAAAVNVQQAIPDTSHVAALSDLVLLRKYGHSERGVTLATPSDPTDAYAQWQRDLGARLMLQADLTWSGMQDGYVAAGWGDRANPYSSLWWNLEPVAQHCSDCPVFAAGSPYDPPWVDGGNTLNATPGDGHSACGAACRCDLSYGGAVGGVLSTQDMKTWAPEGTPDLPDGPMQPIQPPAQRAPQQSQTPAPEEGESGQPEKQQSPHTFYPVRESPYGPLIPGGDFNEGQKRALDLYRLAELEWNRVRGEMPELPNFFTLANPNFTWARLSWKDLTRAQQKALSLALEAFAVWDVNVPESWREFAEDEGMFADREQGDYLLNNPYPRQSHGRFGFGPGHGAHGGESHGEAQHAGAGHVEEHVGAGHHAGGGAGGGDKTGSEELRKAQDHLAAIRRKRNDPARQRDDSPAALERLNKARERVQKLESQHPDAPNFEERFDMQGHPRAQVISRSAPEEPIRPFPASRGHGTGHTEVDEHAHDALENIFGRRLSDDEVRSIVGAQSGDDVYVVRGSEQSVRFKLEGQHYEAERTLNGMVMHNDIFRIDEEARGQGLGTQIFADQVRGLNALGVVRIDTFAARTEGVFNGYYTWPRLGYNAAVHLPSIYHNYPRDIAGEDGWTDLHTLMRTREGRDWWREHGDAMSMSFDTRTGSRSMQVLDAYLRARGMGGL